jgi:TM2 domain-containing membrane protein YozV
MCPECQHPAFGSVYCDVHLPAPPPVSAQLPVSGYPASPYVPPAYATSPVSSPYTTPAGSYTAQAVPDESVHPVLALLLGLIPGVGAIYNGQYAKGLVHTVVFGLLVSTIVNSHDGGMEALLGIMIGAWVFYMAFEAYHTARKRRFGVTVEEFPSQFDFRAGGGKIPAGAILLIGLGFILLLDTTNIISIDDFGKYWPVGLILVGVYMLYSRLSTEHSPDHANKDAEARR